MGIAIIVRDQVSVRDRKKTPCNNRTITASRTLGIINAEVLNCFSQ